MGPIALNFWSLLASARRALLHNFRSLIPSTDAASPRADFGGEDAPRGDTPGAGWERSEDLGQIVRVYDCQSQAHRQVNAAADALHELLVEMEQALTPQLASRTAGEPDAAQLPRPVQVLRSAA